MKRACPSLLALLLVGCASTSSDGTGAATPDAMPSGESAEVETQGLQRKLEVANARLDVAQLEAKAGEQKQATRVLQATAEVEMAQARLTRFQQADKPHRLASARLALESSKDRAQEAADELKQIELMYSEQDLDDLTAEFVVSRGQRNAARAAARLEIQAAELEALETLEIPEEESALTHALDNAKAALAEAESSAEIAGQKAELSLLEARNAVTEIKDELAASSEKASS